MDKLERILAIVRTWQHGFHWRALQHALEDGKRDDLPDDRRKLDHLLFRSWSKQSSEVREYLRENAPRLLKLMPPVDWGNDLLRYDPDGLTREMVEMEGELLAMRAEPEKPAATEPATNATNVTDPALLAQFANLLDDTALKVLTIIQDGERSVDDKLRLLSALDVRHYGKTSKQLADLLGVTEQAIRKTKWWKVDRHQNV